MSRSKPTTGVSCSSEAKPESADRRGATGARSRPGGLPDGRAVGAGPVPEARRAVRRGRSGMRLVTCGQGETQTPSASRQPAGQPFTTGADVPGSLSSLRGVPRRPRRHPSGPVRGRVPSLWPARSTLAWSWVVWRSSASASWSRVLALSARSRSACAGPRDPVGHAGRRPARAGRWHAGGRAARSASPGQPLDHGGEVGHGRPAAGQDVLGHRIDRARGGAGAELQPLKAVASSMSWWTIRAPWPARSAPGCGGRPGAVRPADP